jgi:hypothetical protein
LFQTAISRTTALAHPNNLGARAALFAHLVQISDCLRLEGLEGWAEEVARSSIYEALSTLTTRVEFDAHAYVALLGRVDVNGKLPSIPD